MRSETRDLLRLSLTAAAIAGLVLLASFAGSPAISPPSEAIARADSVLHVRSISHDRFVAPPKLALPNAIEAAAPHRVSIGKPRSGRHVLLALGQ